MKIAKLLVYVIGFMLAGAAAAHAAPIGALFASMFASITAFGSTVVGGFLVNMAASIALSALAMALQKKSMNNGGITTDTTTSGGDTPQKIILGRYATGGGAICPPMTYDFAGSKDNGWITYVIALGDYPVTGLESIIVDNIEYNILNDVVPAPHTDMGKYIDGSIKEYAFIKFHDGNQTVADPMLLSKFHNYPNRPWSEDHKLIGVPYAIASFAYHRDKFTGLPDMRFVVRGSAIYDPRKDTSVGGSGAQRWADKSTWAFSDNPVVMVYNIIRGFTLADGNKYGINAPASALPLDRWMAAMNVCDEAGSETSTAKWWNDTRRYRAGIEFALNTEPLEVIETLLTACGGKLSEIGGTYNITVGPPAFAAASITDENVIISESRDFTVFGGLESTYNSIHATYPSPESLWESVDAEPYYNDEWIAEDDGRRLIADLRLSAVPYPGQVRRLMRETASDNRRQRIHVITLGPWSLSILPLDVINWSSVQNGYSNKKFEVTGKVIDTQTLNCTFTIRERDPADYNPNAAFDAVLPGSNVVVSDRPVIQGVDGFIVTSKTFNDADGVSKRVGLQIGWNNNLVYDSLSYQIQTTPNNVTVVQGSVADVRAGAFTISEGILPQTAYRVRLIGRMSGRASEWSSFINVSTPAAWVTNNDFEDGIGDFLDGNGVNAIRSGYSLPASGDFDGQQFFNRTDGKMYSWNTTTGQWVPYVQRQIEGALDHTSFASTVSIPRVVTTLPTTGANGQFVTLQSDGKLYRWNGSAFVAAVPATDISGQLISAQIANNAIAARNLAADSVGSMALQNAAVSGIHMQANSIITAHLTAGVVTANELAVRAVSAKHVAISDWENIITNSQFTGAIANGTSVDGWNLPAGVTTWISSQMGNMPTQAAVCFASTGAAIYAVEAGPEWKTTTPGTSYQFDCQVRGAGGQFTPQLIVGWYDRDNAFITQSIVTRSPISASVWSAFNGEVIAPANAYAMRVLIGRVGNAAGESGNGWITSPSFRRKNGGELVVDGSIIGKHIAANTINANHMTANSIGTNALISGSVTTAILAVGAVGADQISANAISARHLVVGNTRNMIPNGNHIDLSNVASYWGAATASGSRSYFLKSANAAFSETGSGSLAVQKPSGNLAASVSTSMLPQYDFPVEAGKKYYAETAIRSNTGVSSTGAYVRILWLDANKAQLSASDIAANVGITAAWVSHSNVITAPVSATFVRITVINSGSSNTQNLLVDRIVFKEMDAGSLIVDGTITGQHIAASTISSDNMNVGWLNGERLSASYLDVNSLLDIGANAGLRYQKPSVTADTTDGLYFGYDGSRFGFAASRTNAGKRQSIKLASSTGLQLLNARHFVSGFTVPTSVNRTTNLAKTALPANIKEISFDMMGGGGGGAAGMRTGAVSGAAGTNTIVRLYDGATLKHTFTATAGAGGAGTASAPHQAIPAETEWGLAYGAGGYGGQGSYYPSGDGGTPRSFYAKRGGNASLVSVDKVDISTWKNPQIEIVIGSGGAGGVATSETGVSGGAGSPGRVMYSYSTVKDIPADVVPLEPTAVGSFVTHSSGAGSFPNLGAGYWMIHRNTASDGVGLGYVTVAPNSILRMNESGVVSFVSSQTPTYTGGLGSRQVWYSFHSMGNWG